MKTQVQATTVVKASTNIPSEATMNRMIVEGLQDPYTVYEIYNRLKNLNIDSALSNKSTLEVKHARNSIKRKQYSCEV